MSTKYFFLFFLIGCFNPLVLQAQKTLANGQFTFKWWLSEKGGQKEVAQSVLLVNGAQQRFETQTDGLFLGLMGLSQSVTYPDKNQIFLGTWRENKELSDSATIQFDTYQKNIQSNGKSWSVTTEKNDRKKIFGYDCYKSTATSIIENQKITIVFYCTPDIKLPFNSLLNMHYQGLVLEGFPLEIILADNSSDQSISIRIQDLVLEKPDNIWFNLRKTPYYPLYEPETKEKESAESNAFLVDWYLWQQKQQQLFSDNHLEKTIAAVQAKCAQNNNAEQFLETKRKIEKATGVLQGKINGLINYLSNYTQQFTAPLYSYFFTQKELSSLSQAFRDCQQTILAEVQPLATKLKITPDATGYTHEKIMAILGNEEYLKQLDTRETLVMLHSLANTANRLSLVFWESIATQIDAPAITMNQFMPIITAKKSSILLGETFEGEVVLGTFADLSPQTAKVTVNGQALAIQDGKASFALRPSGYNMGEQTLTAKIQLTDPLSGSQQTVESTYSYEVTVPSVVVAPEKTGVLYLGVENPIMVAAPGISRGDIRVGVSNGKIQPARPGSYFLSPTSLDTCVVTITIPNRSSLKFTLPVKKIPNPSASLNGLTDNKMKPDAMAAQKGLYAVLPPDFYFDVRCVISSYTLVHLPAQGSTVTVKETSAAFSSATQKQLQMAQKGDIYLFKDIYGQCPGDKTPRSLESLAVDIE